MNDITASNIDIPHPVVKFRTNFNNINFLVKDDGFDGLNEILLTQLEPLTLYSLRTNRSL